MNTPIPALDFAAIRSRCPRAFAALEKHLQHDWSITDSGQLQYLIEEIADEPIVLQYNPRDLYGFFDEQGLNIIIYKPGRRWLYRFEGCPEVIWGWDTRAAAEAAAFMAAFERLDGVLNQGKEETK